MAELTKGRVLLSRAMATAGHTVTAAETAVGAGLGVLGKVLRGERGVGTDLAARIETAYPSVPMRAWTEPAEPGEAMAEIPRGRQEAS